MVTSGTSRQVDAALAVGGANFVGQRRCLRQRRPRRTRAARSYLRTAISISMPGSSISPSTSVTRPSGCECSDGGSVNSTATTWPAAAPAIALRGIEDVLAVALVFGRDQPDAALVQQAADDRCLLALDDLEHAPFGPALLVVADDAHLDAVAVQDRAHLLRRKKDVGMGALADDETVAVAVAEDRALHFGHQLVADGVLSLGCCCFDDKVRGCLRCPGGGIGRRTSFRY